MKSGYARWRGRTPPNSVPKQAVDGLPPIFQGFRTAAVNGKRLDNMASDLTRIEKKIDALLVGFGLDPSAGDA